MKHLFLSGAGAGLLGLLAAALPASPAQADHCGSCGGRDGRMTGGGSILPSGNGMIPDEPIRVTHGFQLHCDIEGVNNNLQINWDSGNRFHLTEMLYASCGDRPQIDPENPEADFDSYYGEGTGRCNGVDGALVFFYFQDAGEPGVRDYAEIRIAGCPGGDASQDFDLAIYGLLEHGNHQAHRETGSRR